MASPGRGRPGSPHGARRRPAVLPLFGFFPELPSNLKCVDPHIVPPSGFVAAIMEVTMMLAAEWDGEVIANFSTKSARLRKSEMVRVARLGAAEKARLRCYEAEVFFVAETPGL